MKSTVIIDSSDKLAWHQRLASNASTAALWGGWLWLWSPLLTSAGPLGQLGAHVPAWGLNVLAAAGPSMPHSLAAIAGTSGTLVMWRKLPRVRAKAAPELPISDYARRFDLQEHEVEAGRRAAVCVVFHHPDGRIARIDCREPEGRAAA